MGEPTSWYSTHSQSCAVIASTIGNSAVETESGEKVKLFNNNWRVGVCGGAITVSSSLLCCWLLTVAVISLNRFATGVVGSGLSLLFCSVGVSVGVLGFLTGISTGTMGLSRPSAAFVIAAAAGTLICVATINQRRTFTRYTIEPLPRSQSATIYVCKQNVLALYSAITSTTTPSRILVFVRLPYCMEHSWIFLFYVALHSTIFPMIMWRAGAIFVPYSHWCCCYC